MKMLEYFTQIVFEFGIKNGRENMLETRKSCIEYVFYKIIVLNKSGIPKFVFWLSTYWY